MRALQHLQLSHISGSASTTAYDVRYGVLKRTHGAFQGLPSSLPTPVGCSALGRAMLLLLDPLLPLLPLPSVCEPFSPWPRVT